MPARFDAADVVNQGRVLFSSNPCRLLLCRFEFYSFMLLCGIMQNAHVNADGCILHASQSKIAMAASKFYS